MCLYKVRLHFFSIGSSRNKTLKILRLFKSKATIPRFSTLYSKNRPNCVSAQNILKTVSTSFRVVARLDARWTQVHGRRTNGQERTDGNVRGMRVLKVTEITMVQAMYKVTKNCKLNQIFVCLHLLAFLLASSLLSPDSHSL